MEWVRSSVQDALFIKIKFEKAYHRIEWYFITIMLNALGFGPHFISSIKMLFWDASIVLTMNGSQFESIPLSRSMHQGFPLAPSLFILVMEAFSYLLDHQASQDLICVISLLNS